jgi:hypothetical protein
MVPYTILLFCLFGFGGNQVGRTDGGCHPEEARQNDILCRMPSGPPKSRCVRLEDINCLSIRLLLLSDRIPNRRYRMSSGAWRDQNSIRAAGEEDLGEMAGVVGRGWLGWISICREEGEGLAVVGDEEGVALIGTKQWLMITSVHTSIWIA